MFLSTVLRDQVADMLKSPDTFATVLAAIILDHYGIEAFNWEQDTLDRELHGDFGVMLPQINRDKLQAVITLQTTNQFYTDWPMFNNICEALNNDPVDFEILDLVPPEYMAWGITEAALFEDPKNLMEFDPEVKTFMGTLLRHYGITHPPDALQIATMPEIDSEPPQEVDAAMVNASFKKRESDNGYIVEYVTKRMQMLLDQLDTVPLEQRDKDMWTQFVGKVRKTLDRHLSSLAS